ncbi:MAG: lysozyme inhibitor LprI family protein [Acidobacteria bacterium]|nr:lysozyme inhibitor LprI family protein [Acidobacteriota bacterium]
MNKFLRAAACALVFGLCCAAPADAQRPRAPQPPAQGAGRDDADEGPCPDAMTQPDMNRCTALEFQKADAALNKIYRRLMKDAGAAEKAKLRAAQLAWIKFRDAHCEYESFGNKGGSIYPMVYSFCLADVTGKRAEQFEEILKEAEAR